MSHQPGTSSLPRWAMLGGGGLALLLAGFVVLGPGGKPAQAGEPTMQGLVVQNKDNLVVSVTVTNPDDDKLIGTLRAELIDQGDTIVDSKEKEIAQAEKNASYRFELRTNKKALDNLRLRYSIGKHKVETPVNKALLVKGHETALVAGTEFHAGTSAAFRCEVHGVRSLSETVPLPQASVEVRLKDKDGKVTEVFKGQAGEDGVASSRIKVPSLPAGNYKMEVVTKSALGEEKLERDVKVKAEPKVLLVTDKPLYQPGQVIHIRALCLGTFDLRPVADTPLVFEVEDSKGNKVFKREHKTTPHGVAAVDFQLASEVNQGEYRVRAVLGDKQADKTVTVKPYVLPKFKSNLTADKKFYLPKETVKADLQVDYFFGKPVAGAKYKVTASTFDVAFKDFQTAEGKTDEQGHAKVEIKLPDYFVGQPLAKGNALVKLEVKVTDTADHTETITRTYTVSDQPIKVSLMPEAGRLIPGVENRIFVAALTPDGSPVQCEVQLAHVKEIKDKFIGKVKTGANGLAEIKLTPDPKLFRQDQWQQQEIEMLGGKQQVWGPKNFLDLKVTAKEEKGPKIESQIALSSDMHGGNVLLRLDKAIYKGGDTINVDVRTTAGLPTTYLDVVKDGQTLLTSWFDVKDGKAGYKLDLPAEVFGTLELHAYQMLTTGEILRDARIVYVQPASELKISVKADKDVYLPGQDGKIRFEVTDQDNKPTAAALGVIIVDEAVYALQEMQPGLEKVYFTLQQELLKPQAQAVYKPGETIDNLVIQPVLNAERQQVAQALMCAVQPKPPANWNVNPALGRKQRFEGILQGVGAGIYNLATTTERQILVRDKKTNEWKFRDTLLDDVAGQGWIDKGTKDPFDQPLSLENLVRYEKEFSPNNLAQAVTVFRMATVASWVRTHTEGKRKEWCKDGKWQFPETLLEDLAKQHNWNRLYMHDGWGNKFRLVKVEKKRDNKTGWDQFDYHTLVSSGPDTKFGSADDVKMDSPPVWRFHGGMFDDGTRLGKLGEWRRNLMFDGGFPRRGGFPGGFGAAGGVGGGGFGGGGGGPFPPMAAQGGFPRPEAKNGGDLKADKGGAPQEQAGGAAPSVRIRESFPETMLWRPLLITDERGVAILDVPFADSITSWRMTASASSARGHLGGVTAPLRVFQDFFVDLDLPVALTKNDEVSFPVAVYNYLPEKQTVKLQLVEEPWFELVDGKAERSLDVKPGEVTAMKYRIRAKKLGHQPLTVKAFGSKMSDAIKRVIEVVPDGQMKEQVVNNQLSGKSKHVLVIPDNAIPDASKLVVKVYPGVFSQVLEGVEGLIRLPGG